MRNNDKTQRRQQPLHWISSPGMLKATALSALLQSLPLSAHKPSAAVTASQLDSQMDHPRICRDTESSALGSGVMR